MSAAAPLSTIGLVGLAVMGQNLALNIASKGFGISVWNRSHEKTVATVARAKEEKVEGELRGFEQITEFVQSLQKPRAVIILVQAGKPVDAIIAQLSGLMEPGDLLIDGGNEWYTNTQRRGVELKEKNLLYMGMGVSGGEVRSAPHTQQRTLSSVRRSINSLRCPCDFFLFVFACCFL